MTICCTNILIRYNKTAALNVLRKPISSQFYNTSLLRLNHRFLISTTRATSTTTNYNRHFSNHLYPNKLFSLSLLNKQSNKIDIINYKNTMMNFLNIPSIMTITASSSKITLNSSKSLFFSTSIGTNTTNDNTHTIKITANDNNSTPTPPSSSSNDSSKSSDRPPWSSHPKYSPRWFYDITLIMLVFALAGSTTVRLVRPFLNNWIGLNGSFKEGPWSFRFTYLCCTLPFHSFLLLVFGTLLGKGPFFRQSTLRMWSRILFLNQRK